MRRIVIATPHYYHTTIAIAAIGAGLNVLTEKPLSVHKADCEKVIEAFENRPDKSKIFSEMFNQRTDLQDKIIFVGEKRDNFSAMQVR